MVRNEDKPFCEVQSHSSIGEDLDLGFDAFVAIDVDFGGGPPLGH